MLASSRSRIERQLADSDVVLDVGAWAEPWWRADWVIDWFPYETRGLYGGDATGGPGERFSAETWIQRDACAREPFPFGDDEIDFAVCSHTLEDIRDPVWVCSELARVAKAGYIEVPARVEEQAFGVHGEWVGWSHHRWLIDIAGDRVSFVHKPALLQARSELQVGTDYLDRLEPTSRVQPLFWEGSFDFEERQFGDPVSYDAYLADVPGAGTAGRQRPAGSISRLLRRLGRAR